MKDTNFQKIGTTIIHGQRLLALSFLILDQEQLKNNFNIKSKSTAWPQVLLEVSEILEGSPPKNTRIQYTSCQTKKAWEVCEIYSKLPFSAIQKKITLRKARNPSEPWKNIAKLYGLNWYECRQFSDTILIQLMDQWRTKLDPL